MRLCDRLAGELTTDSHTISILPSTQTCQWKMFVWGGDTIQTVNIQPLISTIDLDTFVTNGEWELRATRAWREVVSQGGETFAYVLYEVTLRRRPSLLVLTVMLPVLVLALVNVFVFTVPSEAGGYGVHHSLRNRLVQRSPFPETGEYSVHHFL